MVRPRGGNFVYTEDELLKLFAHINQIGGIKKKNKDNLIESVVTGVLTSSNKVNVEVMKQVVA